MKAKLLSYLIGLMLRELTADRMKELADYILDWFEDKIIGSENKLDDKLLPAIEMVRKVFDIPD